MQPQHLGIKTPLSFFKKLKGIIFDCDGVLIDSIDANIWYYNQFRKKFDLAPLTDDEIKYVHAHTVFEAIKHIIPEEHLEKAMAMREDPSLLKAGDYIKLSEELVPFLEWLKSNSINIAVNTNRTDSLDMVLNKFGINHYFSPKVTATTLSKTKPEPDGVYYILDQWGLNAEDVVYIGDTFVDEQCAKAAGVDFWAYRNSELEAVLHIEDYKILKQKLQQASDEC